MRRILTILLIATVTLGISSCRKFLEESSPDLIRPVTVEHYKELLQGEANFKNLYAHGWFVDMMTDNMTTLDLGYPTSNVDAIDEKIKFAYQWGADLEHPTGTFTDQLFQTLYKNILIANTCIVALDKMEGTEAERAVLRGQAHFTRAYGYFILVNLYAQAYNESDDQTLSVPVVTDPTPTLKGYNRSTRKEAWDLINSDIITAVTSLKNDKEIRGHYEINYKAALLLASRIFLYQENYDESIQYAERFMQLEHALKNISTETITPSPSGSTPNGKSFLYAPANPEVLFTFSELKSSGGEGSYLNYTRNAVALANFAYCVSNDGPASLFDSYEQNDKRKTNWFSAPSGGIGQLLTYPYHAPMKVSFHDGCRTTQTMRSAEVYLNLAEAYARKANPEPAKAITLLNDLRKNRIKNYISLTGADFSSPSELIDFVLEERRRELCFEEFHRWWDLRRTGQPSLTHQVMGKTYVLNEKDPAYVLNFPKDELDFNMELISNNRPQRNAQ